VDTTNTTVNDVQRIIRDGTIATIVMALLISAALGAALVALDSMDEGTEGASLRGDGV